MEDVVVLIPCFNEEITIAKVINDWRNELPDARIYVFNNNSTDKTAEIAIRNGAELYNVTKQGIS